MAYINCFFNPPDMTGWISAHTPHVVTTDDKERQANSVTQEYKREPYLPEGVSI